jgi:hypothetical protein
VGIPGEADGRVVEKARIILAQIILFFKYYYSTRVWQAERFVRTILQTEENKAVKLTVYPRNGSRWGTGETFLGIGGRGEKTGKWKLEKQKIAVRGPSQIHSGKEVGVGRPAAEGAVEGEFLSAGRYVGNVIDGKVTLYGRKKRAKR